MNSVLVRGDGVAAYCCVRVLQRAGMPVRIETSSRPRLPAIMLSEAAVKLIADVFGHRDLFRELPRIERRTVLWGQDAAPVVLPHSAVVVSEETLLQNIRPDVASAESALHPDWEIFSFRPLPPESTEHAFGARAAHAYRVELKNDDGPYCWIESAEDGWLFLIGSGDGSGWLLSVGTFPGGPLDRSRLIAPHIRDLQKSGGEFPAHPRIMEPLCGATERMQWLACGTAALAFDPICGDGTAHAVREAVLAAAAIRAIAGGERAEDVFAHYEARLTAGFQRHLANCAGFYRSGGDGVWWKKELVAVEQGVEWCAGRLRRFPGYRYRLNGYELEAVA